MTTFRQAREFLLAHRDDADAARAGFRWPRPEHFNWVTEWFEPFATGNRADALRVVRESGVEATTFADMSDRSTRVARWLRDSGAERGDRVLLMLTNVTALWEAMLAAIRLGLVVIPATSQLTPRDLDDRIGRGNIKHIITDAEGAAKLPDPRRLAIKLSTEPAPGFAHFDDARGAPAQLDPVATRADDPLLLYFTSGTTAKPKLVLHTHASYPIGHLSTMYWIGLQGGDVHQNISSPGWAKHAWSSLFAPWNAGATVVVHDQARFSAARTLAVLRDHGITTLCAPPTVWRMLILESLGDRPAALRELVSAGEPLNPEVIDAVQRAWSVTVRDGYGQTETTAQVGNSPGMRVKPGSMGRPLPGYDIAMLDSAGAEAREGELSIRIAPERPAALMTGYLDDPQRTAEVTAGGFYRTGDEASVDGDGYIHFVGRGDDVFKSSDYRISPFELESVLVEHDAVAEAAVVPSPDAVRLAVPKAFVALRAGVEPSEAVARSIFEHCSARLPPYMRVRRLEFAALPKTISGKIRRVELRNAERSRREVERVERAAHEYWLDDFKP
jgi:acetyl-CoA synthetase|nr:AMP-binding protein [Kofleriaceae bacterium]